MKTAVMENDPKAGVKNQEETVAGLIKGRLDAFVAAVEDTGYLEFDGITVDSNSNKSCNETTKDSCIKVLNHSREISFTVSTDAIIRTPIDDLINALTTGKIINLHGVTRIVGYYSRINNWNSSKRQELIQRIESRRDGVGYAVDGNRKPQDVDETIEFLNRM